MPITGSFEQYRLDLLDPRHGQPGGIAGQSPRHEDGSVDEGRAWAHALGVAQDAEAAKLRIAGLSRLPALCPADALDVLGDGAFALPRMPGQSDDSYRATLTNARPIYDIGGSAQAVIDALHAYGIPDVQVVPIFESPAPFLPASSLTSYSEFYVLLGPNYGATGIGPLILGSWTLGGAGSVLGTTATRDQIVAIKRIILRWKAAHGLPIKVGFLGSAVDVEVPFTHAGAPSVMVTAFAHPFVGGELVRAASTGTLPLGLFAGTTYAIEVQDADTLTLLTVPGGVEVSVGNSGNGVHSITRQAPGCAWIPLGRCLGDTWGPLGSATCILGGYQI